MALALALATLAAAASLSADSPSWRFRKADRTVKVVVLHGSVGAWQRNPYHQRLENACTNVEVRNLSKSGLGAWAIKQRFKEMVLANRRIDPAATPEQEFWVLFGAGLNSVTAWQKTNSHLRSLIVLAHSKGMKVMALTPTPWGTDREDRFQGLAGLTRRRATQKVADYILGRLAPKGALGSFVADRSTPEAAWSADELADIGVDVYDSPLRDRDAEPRDRVAVRTALEKSRSWARAHKGLSEAARESALEADAQLGAEVPQYFMKPELRAFDHIHPNAEGHRLLAKTICPKAPASWGCDCNSI